MRTRTWLSCALTAALLVGCSSDPEAAPRDVERSADEEQDEDQVSDRPPPEQTIVVEPEPPEDVAGTVTEVTVTDLSETNSGLHRDGSEADQPVPVDQDAVEATVAATTAWLDAHLTDVQSGGEGRVVEAGLEGDVTVVSGALTGPEHPVTDASYVITLGARGSPEWVRASVTVERAGGSTTATFVFVPGGEDVRLIAAQPGEGDPVTEEPAGSDGDTAGEESA